MTYTRSTSCLSSLTAAALLLCAASFPAAAEGSAEEAGLINVLQSEASLQQKDAACARLKRVGTAACIPALSRLLLDTNLSHSARYALESMPWPEAGRALVEALPKADTITRVGIINSLGQRKERAAVPSLSAALNDSDPASSSAAAQALGQIGDDAAKRALEQALGHVDRPLRDACARALLVVAQQLHAAGNDREAARLFQILYGQATTDGMRVAAYRGVILSGGKGATKLAAEAITKTTDARQLAALQLVHELPQPDATKVFTGLLRQVQPLVQVALIEGLAQRNDPNAAAGITSTLKSGAPEVRLAALRALGRLGEVSTVRSLTVAAASTTGAEKAAARQALVDLNAPGVKEALLREMKDSDPKVQAEAAQALGERREPGSVTKLIELAQAGNGAARRAALGALAALAGERELPAMVQLVTKSKTKEDRLAAAEALNTVYQRLKTTNPGVSSQPLSAAMEKGPTEVRLAILPVCSGLSDLETARLLKAAAADNNPEVRVAGIRALCDSVNPELLPEIARLTQDLPEENLKSVAIAGFVRLATDEASASVPVSSKLATFERLLSSNVRPEQTRMLLAGVAQMSDPRAIKLVEPLLAVSSVKTEAARALLKLVPTLADPEAASAALSHVLSTGGLDAETIKSARSALDTIEARADYLIAWQISGPFRKAGADYASLFDTPFPPETDNPDATKWTRISPSSDPAKPGVIDLLKALGGEQCVAYARTWVFSPKQQETLLEMGSDDGLKVWINGKLVHANNTARPLQPGSDKAKATLNEGWNLILFKVTQNNLGWEFCARFLGPDGSRLKGLRGSPEQH